jgi:hypothetical protein
MLPKDFYYDENADQETPMKKLPTFTKIIYGFGDIGFSMTGTIIAAYFPIFLTDVIGIAPAVAAIALFIGKSWDYINDPLIGHLSDRTRSRWVDAAHFCSLARCLMDWRSHFYGWGDHLCHSVPTEP